MTCCIPSKCAHRPILSVSFLERRDSEGLKSYLDMALLVLGDACPGAGQEAGGETKLMTPFSAVASTPEAHLRRAWTSSAVQTSMMFVQAQEKELDILKQRVEDTKQDTVQLVLDLIVLVKSKGALRPTSPAKRRATQGDARTALNGSVQRARAQSEGLKRRKQAEFKHYHSPQFFREHQRCRSDEFYLLPGGIHEHARADFYLASADKVSAETKEKWERAMIKAEADVLTSSP